MLLADICIFPVFFSVIVHRHRKLTMNQVHLPVIVSFDRRKKCEWSLFEKNSYLLSNSLYVVTYKNLNIVYGYVNTSNLKFFNMMTTLVYNQCSNNNYLEFFLHLEHLFNDYSQRLRNSPFYIPKIQSKSTKRRSDDSDDCSYKLKSNGKSLSYYDDNLYTVDGLIVSPEDNLQPLNGQVERLISIIRKTFTDKFLNDETIMEMDALKGEICSMVRSSNGEIVLAINNIMNVIAGLEFYYLLGSQKKFLKNGHTDLERQQMVSKHLLLKSYNVVNRSYSTNSTNESNYEDCKKFIGFERKQLMMMYMNYEPFIIASEQLKEKMFPFLKNEKLFVCQ